MGMRFVVECGKAAGVTEQFLFNWFDYKSKETRRKRLHGWRLWQEFCLEKGYTGEDLKAADNPPIIVTQFLWYLEEKGIKAYRVSEAYTAVHALWEIIRCGMTRIIGESLMVREALQRNTGATKKGPRYREIWDLRILVEYIRKGPEPHLLGACWARRT
jgi:hypothetical protein